MSPDLKRGAAPGLRRPLAAFALVFFCAVLVAVWLGTWPWLAVALCALALLAAGLVWLRGRWGGLVPLAAAAVLCGLVVVFLYNAVVVAPRRQLAGGTYVATARVLEVRPGYGDDDVHATLQLLRLDGERQRPALRVQVYGLGETQPGALLRLQLRFTLFGDGATERQGLGRGYALAATVKGQAEYLGESHTLVTRLRGLQYAASESIRAKLPQRLSGIAAAMATGDRRFVPAGAGSAYRAAGLGHLLVVSGLHLSILCGAVQGAVFALTRRRRIASVACIVFVLFFIAFTGATPSVVRSGIAWVIISAAGLLHRRADTYTSLGVAAIVLLCQNPYAAANAGLQLSFAATLGTLAAGGLEGRLRRRWLERPAAPPLRAARWLLRKLLPSALVMVATLPVLVGAGMSVSLFTMPANLLVLPFVPVLLGCCLAMALPAVPVLGWLARLAALLGGTLLVGLEKLTGLCAALPGAEVPVGGAYLLVVVLAVYAVALAGHRARRLGLAALGMAAVMALGVLMHLWLDAGTVKVLVAGANNPSLVVVQNGRAVVLYRSRGHRADIEEIFASYRVRQCALLVDMRQKPNSNEYEAAFAPQQTVVAQPMVGAAVYHPIANAEVTLVRQGQGTVACVDVAGYRIGLYAGAVNLEHYAALDVLVAGSGGAQGSYGALLYRQSPPDWAAPGAALVRRDGETMIWIRPGGGIRYREISDGGE